MSDTVDDLLVRSPEEFRTRAIQALVPEGTEWSFVSDEDGYTIKFPNPMDSDPTKSEIDAKALELQAGYVTKQYQRNRAEAFPELKEQFDLLFHDMSAGKGTKDGEWYNAVAKVKSDNPKP